MNRQSRTKSETRMVVGSEAHNEISTTTPSMPLYLQIIRPSEFVRMNTEGKLDFEASRGALAKLARAMRARSISRAMLDGRKMRTELTPDDLAALVRSFHAIGFSQFQRLALLHTGDQTYRARLFALIGKLSGWMISAFDDYERAMEWLAEEPGTARTTDPAPAGETIPIRQVKTRSSSPKRLR